MSIADEVGEFQMIRLSNISKSYRSAAGKESVLEGLNFELDEGEYVAVMGASGTGKSTLMNIPGTPEQPNGGKYIFRDQKIDKMGNRKLTFLRNEGIGLVFKITV